jgi:hypothetical protein
MSPLAWVLGLSALLFAIFLVISGVYYMRQNGRAARDGKGGALFSSGSVGVIELNGVIMDSKKILRRR